MARLSITIFYDPKAAESAHMVERMANLGPSLHIGVVYVDITGDKELLKKYESIAPIATMAGSIIFSGEFDEQNLIARVRRIQRK
jgi:hypothetical protein